LTAHTASSRWLSSSSVAGSHRTAIGSRTGWTTFSSPLSRSLLLQLAGDQDFKVLKANDFSYPGYKHIRLDRESPKLADRSV
jgi:hypothetical protein